VFCFTISLLIRKMKISLMIAIVACVVAATVVRADPGAGELATYLPDSGPFDNPATDITPTPTLPSTPSCTIRPQTVFEIRKMRADAKQIGMSIMYEVQTMEKRKAYIESMTAYLNDRIRELNKVKADLAAEQKWVTVSNQRIAELAQREKLIKLQDVMGCIEGEQNRLRGEDSTKQSAMASMKAQADAIQANISKIRSSMGSVTGEGAPEAGAPEAGPAAGAEEAAAQQAAAAGAAGAPAPGAAAGQAGPPPSL
jgi:peptidoglycan hydrolase CwlO-like protein